MNKNKSTKFGKKEATLIKNGKQSYPSDDMSRETKILVSNCMIGGAAGVAIDVVANTGFVFTIAGIIVGSALAVVLRRKNHKNI